MSSVVVSHALRNCASKGVEIQKVFLLFQKGASGQGRLFEMYTSRVVHTVEVLVEHWCSIENISNQKITAQNLAAQGSESAGPLVTA